MKRLLMPVLLLVALAACDRTPEAAPPAPAATAPATGPATPASVPEAPAADATPADTAGTDTAPASESADTAADAPATDATDTTEATDTADTTAETATTATPEAPAAPAPPPYDPATSPRRDTDYTVLPTAQPTFGQGGIEVAEVFAYTCIHCANLQPSLSSWKARQPADVRVEYVPAVFGGVADNFARAFFAAQATGLLDETHDAMFNAVLVERKLGSGSVEEIADYYATQGANRESFLSTMQSFSVTAKLNRAKQFALRANVNATPTVIVNGKYSASMTRDRGPQGLLDTIDFLVAHERAGSTPP